MEDLLRRFDNTKRYMAEDSGVEPTDKEVWLEMRAISKQNLDYAIIDDMQDYSEIFSKRISMIDGMLANIG